MPDPVILFAPGAGAPSSSKWMQRWAARLGRIGTVTTLDYPYMRAGRRSPDPLPKLVAAHRAALDEARAGHTGKVVLAGKSMGSRVGCHVSLEATVSGLVCFGYPLKAAGQSGAVRDAVLVSLKAPILFIQGTRDPLCPLELLESVHARMTARSELMIIEGGDHSLEVTAAARKAMGETQDAVEERIFARVSAFVAG
jgi:predicted alpha/beta-hydrolase family hydrolase